MQASSGVHSFFVLVRMAFRNLREHRSKTLIIGTIIALGVAVLTLGNTMVDTAAQGIRTVFIDNYTGHVFISGKADGPVSLFGVTTPGRISPTPTIAEYPRVMERVQSLQGVEGYSTQLSSFGIMRMDGENVEGLETSVFNVLFAVDPESYAGTFPPQKIIAGSWLKPGERGVVLSEKRLDRIVEVTQREAKKQGMSEEEAAKLKLEVGDLIRIISFGGSGLPRITAVPIRGIFEENQDTEGSGAEFISFIDPQSLRSLLRLNTGSKSELSDTQKAASSQLNALGSEVDFDSLFSDDSLISTAEPSAALADPLASASSETAKAEDEAKQDLQRFFDSDYSALAAGPWHFVLLRLKEPWRDAEYVAELNKYFQEEGIQAQAGNWQAAAGPFAQLTDGVRIVFNIAIAVIGIVAIIIIMNTLVISIIERTSEIGTIRALGGEKSFVWKLFLIETLTIAVVFGVLGTILAYVIVAMLWALEIKADNAFLRVLFDGNYLRPMPGAGAVLFSFFVVSFIGLLAHFYPVAVALKISPIRAIQTEN